MDFWETRREQNRRTALPYQWQQYENSGTVDNFRIAGGLKTGERRGYVYVDSDLHKWADAASRAGRHNSDSRVSELLSEYWAIMNQAVEDDGYLHTFNQIHHPGVRWSNLLIEHELYCMGHFIEAAVENYRSYGDEDILRIGRRTADCICRRFPADLRSGLTILVPGHQEIELALIKLYRISGEREYLDTAAGFLRRRGRSPFPGLHLLMENRSHARRMRNIPGMVSGYEYGENLRANEPPFVHLRFRISALTGSYMQRRQVAEEDTEPHGHAVRWTYMQTALAMFHREEYGTVGPVSQENWRNLTDHHMYVSGGIGALPVVEGFGRRGRLDPQTAYCETCASIGSIFWNRELELSSGETRYAALLEWQLYNSALVGIGADGQSYFYRNPLESDGRIRRHAWFDTACCPSNISRLIEEALNCACSGYGDKASISQFISGSWMIHDESGNPGLEITIGSALPFSPEVTIVTRNHSVKPFLLRYRVPVWTRAIDRGSVRVFGSGFFEGDHWSDEIVIPPTDSMTFRPDLKIDPFLIKRNTLSREGRQSECLFALGRGPLLYCLEEQHNPELDLRGSPEIDPADLASVQEVDPDGGLTFGIQNRAGLRSIRFTPYFDWGNTHEPGRMRVWMKEPQQN